MNVILVSGAFISFFFAMILFLRKEKEISHRIHIFWLIYNALIFSVFYLDFSYGASPIAFASCLFPMPIMEAVFLFLHQKYLLNRKEKIEILDLSLFIFPTSLFFVFLFSDTGLTTFQSLYISIYDGSLYAYILLGIYALLLFGFVVLSLLFIRKTIKYDLSATIKIFSCRRIFYFFFIVLTFISIYLLAIFKIKIAWINMDFLIFCCMLALTLWFGYSSIIKTGYLYDNRSLAELTANGEEPRMTDISTKQDDKVKYKQIDPFLPSSEEDQIDDNQSEPLKLYLPRTETDRIYSQLIYLMEEEKLFLNPMLKLSDLAKNVNVPESYLSKIINYYEKKNFYDFVGYYRVEEFLRLISLYDNEKYSMYYLAFEAGFNSKSTFNNVFRRIKGMSPSEYIKMNKKGPNSSARTTF